jgi:transposase
MRFDIDSQRRDMAEIRKGATWLKPVLIQSALAAGRKKNSSFKTRYHALKGRVGPKKAAVAVAANLLRVVYQMLKTAATRTSANRRPRNPARAAANLANRIRALGYQVDIRLAA